MAPSATGPAERMARVGRWPPEIASSAPEGSASVIRYTLPEIAPVSGRAGGDTAVIETWTDVTPVGTTKTPSSAMSWACGGFSPVAAVTAGTVPLVTTRSVLYEV